MVVSKSDVSAIILLILIVAFTLGIGAFYGNWMYGDWKCGMPEVHCRKEK